MRTRVQSSVLFSALTFFFGVLTVDPAAAQPATADVHQPHDPSAASADVEDSPQPHDMQHMQMEHGEHMWMPPARDGSGTSWLPDDTPMYALHALAGPWTLMAHGNAFLQYLYD